MRIAAFIAASTLGLGLIVGAPAATAADVTLTSAQLTKEGFPKKPNTTGWDGTARLDRNSAPQGQDVIITGKAPSFATVGQVLTMQRYIPEDKKGDGSFKDLNIQTKVNADRSFTLHFQLGLVGTYGYRVGYETSSFSPEFVGFQFQFTTTGAKNGDATTGSGKAIQLTSKQLTDAGFTKAPNTVGWGANPVTISATDVKRGAPVTIRGAAPKEAKAGQRLQLMQFVATDRLGSGHFEPTGITTKVKKNGTFALTFEPADAGLSGYSLGYPTKFEWIGIEFQLRVR